MDRYMLFYRQEIIMKLALVLFAGSLLASTPQPPMACGMHEHGRSTVTERRPIREDYFRAKYGRSSPAEEARLAQAKSAHAAGGHGCCR
jgi:hypothetical protein